MTCVCVCQARWMDNQKVECSHREKIYWTWWGLIRVGGSIFSAKTKWTNSQWPSSPTRGRSIMIGSSILNGSNQRKNAKSTTRFQGTVFWFQDISEKKMSLQWILPMACISPISKFWRAEASWSKLESRNSWVSDPDGFRWTNGFRLLNCCAAGRISLCTATLKMVSRSPLDCSDVLWTWSTKTLDTLQFLAIYT